MFSHLWRERRRSWNCLTSLKKRGVIFHFTLSDVFEMGIERGTNCSVNHRVVLFFFLGEKPSQVAYNSRRANVSEKQTEHMASLWCRLTMPYDTTVFTKALALIPVIDCMLEAIIWDIKAPALEPSNVIVLPAFGFHQEIIKLGHRHCRITCGMETFHNSLKLWTSRLISIVLAGRVAILWFEPYYGLKNLLMYSLYWKH